MTPAPPTTNAFVTVDAGQPIGPLPRPWTTFGYDELNWTYTPRGKRALRAFGEFAERPYFVRAHNLLTSGRGYSWLGRPQDPTPEQLAALIARQCLEEGEPLHVTGTAGGVRIELRLPLHALSLLEVTPT